MHAGAHELLRQALSLARTLLGYQIFHAVRPRMNAANVPLAGQLLQAQVGEAERHPQLSREGALRLMTVRRNSLQNAQFAMGFRIHSECRQATALSLTVLASTDPGTAVT